MEKPILTINDLALYIGCEAMTSNGKETLNISMLYLLTLISSNQAEILSSIKPILRPVSDLTEEEFIEWGNSLGATESEAKIKEKFPQMKALLMERGINTFHFPEGRFNMAPLLVKFLLSKHFDLFGWISKDLAINKNTL